MSTPDTAVRNPRNRNEMLALVDAALAAYGEPTYSALRATFSMAVPDDGADPRSLGLAIAEIRRQRVAHRAVSEELALACMALQRGDIPSAHGIITEAKRFADHHAERLQVALLPPDVTVLAFAREARAYRQTVEDRL